MRSLVPDGVCHVHVDGVQVAVAAASSVAYACAQAGVPIPTFCDHPSLRVTATCNTCMVTANGVVVRACKEPVRQGMRIGTRDDVVIQQRRQSLTVLLEHHPLQCSVCPQSGGCELQSHVATHAPVPATAAAREAPLPTQPGTWLAHPELCVGCTRCVRFADEVLNQPLLALAPGRRPRIVRLHQAEPDGYTRSFSDVCPVGVFATARQPGEPPLWALQRRASVCPGCATGCTVWLDESQQRIHKVRARGGRGFLCDDGYGLVPDAAARVVVPFVKGQLTDWDKALDHMARVLIDPVKRRTLGVVVSAELPSETVAAVAKLALDVWGLRQVYWAKHGQGQGDALLRHPDKNPNTAGVMLLLGPAARDVTHLSQDIRAGAIDALWVLGAERVDAFVRILKAAPLAIASVFAAAYDAPAHHEAEVVLPLASWAETGGSYVNYQGRSQAFVAAQSLSGDALPGWEIVAHFASRLGCDLGLDSLAQVHREMRVRGIGLPMQDEALDNSGAP